jgi:hypothetical protein
MLKAGVFKEMKRRAYYEALGETEAQAHRGPAQAAQGPQAIAATVRIADARHPLARPRPVSAVAVLLKNGSIS